MLSYSGLVFDDFIHGAGSYYTDARHNEDLALADRLVITLTADQASGVNPTVAIQIEQSCDGRRWSNKSPAPEVEATNLGLNPTTTKTRADDGTVPTTVPTQGLVRLRLDFTGTNPSAHIKIFADGRTY
jgi:hypothetical protein